MSNNDEEPYSSIFASLKHPVRRKILRMLSKKPMSYSEMLEVLGVSNSFLTYHLENLGELVSKMEDGKYRLSSFGEDAMATMTRVEDIPTPTSQKSPRAMSNRVAWRSVAVTLGVVCILLIAGLGGATAYYTMTINSKNDKINQLNGTIADQIDAIASLKANITNLMNQETQLQAELNGNETSLNQTQALLSETQTWLSGNITAYNNEVNLYNSYVADHHYTDEDYTTFLDIATLADSDVWVYNQTVSQPANSYASMYFVFFYAGYISVNVTLSTTNTTYVEAIYYAYGISYDNTINVGTNGTAIFPVISNWVVVSPIPTNYTLSNITALTSSSNEAFSLLNSNMLPIPPNIEIRIGNTNTVDNATETVTITYYY
jgi:DNA-binding transcriptional ArsR family regulator/regulator of replication initiation timing